MCVCVCVRERERECVRERERERECVGGWVGVRLRVYMYFNNNYKKKLKKERRYPLSDPDMTRPNAFHCHSASRFGRSLLLLLNVFLASRLVKKTKFE